MTFPRISIANKSYVFTDISLADLLDLTKVNPKHYEQQLSCALSTILQDSELPEKLTTQERYAILLKYLSLVENDLNDEIVIEDFLSTDLDEFNSERIHCNGVSSRHLTGLEAHALEIGSENTIDWMLGAMAITIGCDELQPIDLQTNLKFTGNLIQQRIETLKSMKLERFNELMGIHEHLSGQLNTLVKSSFDHGIVLNPFDGGTDDAPIRFRITAAITGYAKYLLSIATHNSPDF